MACALAAAGRIPMVTGAWPTKTSAPKSVATPAGAAGPPAVTTDAGTRPEAQSPTG
jgi:hypothetical protein